MKSYLKKKMSAQEKIPQTKDFLECKIIGRPEDVTSFEGQPVPHMPLPIPRLSEPFQPDTFELEAQIVFRLIMGAFAQGWLASVQDLMTPHVMSALQKAVQERVDKNLTIEFQVYDAEVKVLPDTLTDKHVKAEIVSQQYGILKDKDGVIVSGNPDVLQEVHEVWQFERGEKRWLLSGIEHQ